MRRLARSVVLIVAAAVVVLAPGMATAGPAEVEVEVLRRTNGSREANGVGSLSRSGGLDTVARAWSQHQLDIGGQAGGGQGHNGSLRSHVEAQVGSVCAWGENVGSRTGSLGSDADEAERMHDLWMASSGHRANIVNPTYDEIGVGVAVGGDRMFVTVVFATRQGGCSTSTPNGGPSSPTSSPSASPSVSPSPSETPSPSSPPSTPSSPPASPSASPSSPPAGAGGTTAPDEPARREPASPTTSPSPTPQPSPEPGPPVPADTPPASPTPGPTGTSPAEDVPTTTDPGLGDDDVSPTPSATVEEDDDEPDVVALAPFDDSRRMRSSLPLTIGAVAFAVAVLAGSSPRTRDLLRRRLRMPFGPGARGGPAAG